jgi:hypothetical protein
MNTQKKNCSAFCLQKGNNSWKWVAGATAATAAGVTASQASAITINLINDYISFAGGNHLNANLTGDGHPDLTIANAILSRYHHQEASDSIVMVNLNGVSASARLDLYNHFGFVRLGSQAVGTTFFTTNLPPSLTGAIPVFFKDLHINGGAPTRGSLEVTVFAGGPDGSPTIQLDSLTYDTPGQGSRLAVPVPDQGSSLALLAMGATGILALRRWRATRERS